MADYNFYGLGDFIQQYDYTDKRKNIRHHIIYMLDRVMSMFEYDGLPDTMPKKMLELYMMVNGHALVLKHEDNLYVCFGGFSGEPDAYYMPKQYIVANPYLQLFKVFDIGTDCVLVKNDTMMYGLMPMFSKFASALVENELTMNMVDINSRISALIDAPDDATKASAEKYLQDIEDGKSGIIASTAFFDGIRAQPYGEHNYQRLTDLIEYEQYMKASWFNELGLNANYNMKREAITSNESQLNDDMLLPFVDDMFNCRKEQLEQINDMFGTNITIKWSSSWEDNMQELELAQMQERSEIEAGINISSYTDTDVGIDTDNSSEHSDISDDMVTDGDVDSNDILEAPIEAIIIPINRKEGDDNEDDTDEDEGTVSTDD